MENTMSDDEMQQSIKKLSDLIKEDTKLNQFRTDDSFYQRALFCTNCDVSAAFKRIQQYYNLVSEHPQWFASKPPINYKHRIEDNDKTILKEYDKEGRGVMIVKLGKLVTDNSSPQEHAQVFELWLELLLSDPKVMAKGISVIIDMKGYSWKLFRWVTPTNISVSAKKVDLYLCKEFILHVVNTSFLVNATIKLIWPFLNERLKKMFKFHFENWPALHDFISPDILPREYGGTAPDINFEKTNERLFALNTELGEKLQQQKISEF